MKFTYYDLATGKITASGECPDGEEIKPRFAGEGVLFAGADPRRHVVVDGAIVDQPPKPVAAPTYQEQRLRAYPSFGDQLDALWKGGAEAEAMRARVLAVKTQYPKPNAG